jgi:TonB family protein
MRLGKSSPTDPPVRRIVLFAVLALFAASSAAAETRGLYRPPPDQPSYENSEAGLKHLIQDALAAGKANDQAKLAELANSMLLPSPEDWFLRVFGPGWGNVYAKLYTDNSSHAAANLVGIFLDLAAEKFPISQVTRFSESCDFSASQEEYPMLAARIVPEQFSVVRFAKGGTVRTLRFLAYVDGGFRFLGLLRVPADQYPGIEKMLRSKPGTGPPDELLEVPPDIQKAKIIHEVPPTYPEYARQFRAQGDVILHAIINKDGKVVEVRVIRGECPFVRASITAVTQWRFSPTVMNGEPVETASIFEFHFAFPF